MTEGAPCSATVTRRSEPGQSVGSAGAVVAVRQLLSGWTGDVFMPSSLLLERAACWPPEAKSDVACELSAIVRLRIGEFLRFTG